jgi:co-chaperonin GroES (HSP10)
MMTMSEFDVSAVDLSNLLNKEPEEKARQVPDPVTYHILCMLPKAEEEFSETGILKSATAMHHEELLSPVLFVAKIGPDAFKDEKRFPSGASCKVGDFIITRPNTGTRMKIHGTEWRLINDDSIEAVVQDPRGIQRPNF